MLAPLNLVDALITDHHGNSIGICYVDYREPTDRTPVPILLKACRDEHSIEKSNSIRLSSPKVFHESGTNKIKDPQEGVATQTTITQTDPVTVGTRMVDLDPVNEELTHAANITGSTVKEIRRTKSVTPSSENRTTRYIDTTTNHWMFCTSMEPLDEEAMTQWHATMEDEYNHTYYIYKPREFAIALAKMVVEQIGPQGQETVRTHTSSGIRVKTKHPSQIVTHGPVAYVEDRYELIGNCRTPEEFLVMSWFTKDIDFKDQREYRFVVQTEQKEPKEIIDLEVSVEMHEALKKPKHHADMEIPNTEISNNVEDQDEHDEQSEDSLRDLHGTIRIIDAIPPIDMNTADIISKTEYLNYDELLTDLAETPEAYSSVEALHDAILNTFIFRDEMSGEQRIRTLAAAFFAERNIRKLCGRFQEPIREVKITAECSVHIILNTNDKVAVQIVNGPAGTIFTHINSDTGYSSQYSDNGLLSDDSLDEFAQYLQQTNN